MKKLTLAVLLLSGTAFTAAADTILFDPEQDGTFAAMELINTQILPNTPVDVQQYLGADLILNNGDAFSETFVYNFSNLTGPNGGFEIYPQAGGLTFTLNLTGTISDVIYGAGIPDLGNDPGNFSANFAATSFNTNFNTTGQDSNVNLSVQWNGSSIGEFDVISSMVTDPIALDGSNVNVGFVFNYAFNSAWAAANQALIDSVWRTANGSMINLDSFFLLSAGSAGPNGTSDGIFGDQMGTFVNVNVKDNGSTFIAVVPEPTSIAILGLGLLGLAGTRRRKA